MQYTCWNVVPFADNLLVRLQLPTLQITCWNGRRNTLVIVSSVESVIQNALHTFGAYHWMPMIQRLLAIPDWILVDKSDIDWNSFVLKRIMNFIKWYWWGGGGGDALYFLNYVMYLFTSYVYIFPIIYTNLSFLFFHILFIFIFIKTIFWQLTIWEVTAVHCKFAFSIKKKIFNFLFIYYLFSWHPKFWVRQ